MPYKGYGDRAAYDRALAAELKSRGVELVCLAGFMRLLGSEFIDQTAETLATSILEAEHWLYPEGIRRIADGRWRVEGWRVLDY